MNASLAQLVENNEIARGVDRSHFAKRRQDVGDADDRVAFGMVIAGQHAVVDPQRRWLVGRERQQFEQG